MSDDRGVSTVLDVSVCLLLLGASVVALSYGTPPAARTGPLDASEAASLLAASTRRVEYRLPPSRVAAGRPRSRTARGTAASLLADATVVVADGDSTPSFVAGVRAAVQPLLRRLPGRVGVVASVRPTDSSVGRVTVGQPPPPGVDVDAATLAVGNATILVRTWSR